MPAEQPGLGGEEQPKEEQQESFESWQARQVAEKNKFTGVETVDSAALTEQETNDILADYLRRHPNPETPPIVQNQGEKIKELEDLIAQFEDRHPLEELTNITILSPELAHLMLKSRDMLAEGRVDDVENLVSALDPEEARKYRLREAARSDIDTITHILGKLEKIQGFPSEEAKRLGAERRRLSRAVGMMNRNMIYHDR